MSPLYFNGYSIPGKKDKEPHIAKVRDMAAFMELREALIDLGSPYRYESIIFNYPTLVDGVPQTKREDFAFLTRDALIIQTTRAPLSDRVPDPPENEHSKRTKKTVPWSFTLLEQDVIFPDLRPYFTMLSRSEVTLSEKIVRRCAPHLSEQERAAIPANFHFRQNHDARLCGRRLLSEAGDFKPDKRPPYHSLGFFLHLPALRHIGCRYILSFGMGCFETLVWNRLVRERYSAWLTEPVFAVVEMDLSNVPHNPPTQSFSKTVPSKILLHTQPRSLIKSS